MASAPGALDVIEHRRLALRAMPPSELRDDYLLYLDDLERKARAAAALPDGSGPTRDTAGDEGGGWTVERSLLTAAGSLVFAYGVWALTSLL